MEFERDTPPWGRRLRRVGEKLGAIADAAVQQLMLRQERKQRQTLDRVRRGSSLWLVVALACTGMVVLMVWEDQRGSAAGWCFFALLCFVMFMIGDRLKRDGHR